MSNNSSFEEQAKDAVLKCQSACESSQNAQSSKVSSISRSMVYGIIGAIWAMMCSQDFEMSQFNDCLKASVIMGFIYLLLDITHYFVDACRYRLESFRLDKKVDALYLFNSSRIKLDNIAICSFIAVVLKYFMSLATSVVFLIGLLQKFGII